MDADMDSGEIRKQRWQRHPAFSKQMQPARRAGRDVSRLNATTIARTALDGRVCPRDGHVAGRGAEPCERDRSVAGKRSCSSYAEMCLGGSEVRGIRRGEA
jgi:hypothetical protein